MLNGAWLGMLFGWLEAMQHWSFINNPAVLTISKVSPAIFWVGPLLSGSLFGLAALLVSLPGLLIRAWPSLAFTTLVCAFAGAYGFATLTKKMHAVGAGVLALGVAVMGWRILRRESATHFVRKSLPAMAVLLALIWGGLWAGNVWRERQWLTQLPSPPASTPNVLIIVLDTVRADHLSLAGYFRQTTPHIDGWAAQGVIFDNAWSNTSWTLPSHATMLTGLPTYKHKADHQVPLNREVPLLPQFLAEHGYITGMFAANYNWLIPTYGFDRGLMRLDSKTPYADAADTVWGRKLYATITLRLGIKQTPVRKNAAAVNAEFVEWLDDYPNRPFFALLNYFDAHSPYDAPPPYDRKFTGVTPGLPDEKKPYQDEINSYDGLLAYMDDQFAALRKELERRGLAQNTIIILTSDHGEGFGEHGSPEHTRELHKSVVHVPLVLVAPGLDMKGERIADVASIEQIPATILELLGIGEHPFPGRSLLQRIDNQTEGTAEPVLAELKAFDQRLLSKSLISNEWQYIWNAADGSEELYRLKEDPLEFNNLATSPETQDVMKEFRERLAAIFPDLPTAKN